jgi:phage recombination protein Bet
MTGDLVAARPSSGALALTPEQHDWTPEQQAALEQLGIAEAPRGDQLVFLHVCQRTGLDPFKRQIYMIGRYDRDLGRKRWTIQTAIDGFRVIAERGGNYLGPVDPQWCGTDGQWVDVWVASEPPVAARAGVRRRGWDEPVWAVAIFKEFAQYTSGGGLAAMWGAKGMPAHMIAKCAEALALRKAFPDDLAGLLIPEEAARADREGPMVVEQTAPAPAVSAAELTGGAEPGGERMTPAQQKRLLEARREVEVDDWWAWASEVVGRPVKSYGHLTGPDGDRLVAALKEKGAEAAAAQQPDTPDAEETPTP